MAGMIKTSKEVAGLDIYNLAYLGGDWSLLY